MDEATFEATVAEALDSLPEAFTRYLGNVEVLIEARASDQQRRSVGLQPGQTLYGLYHGVPLTMRESGMVLLPDTITIFREPLVRDFADRDALCRQIRRTVLHEIAHVFGISDDRLRELNAY